MLEKNKGVIHSLALYFHTIKYLKLRQLIFQVYYRLRKKSRRLFGHRYPASVSRRSVPLNLQLGITKNSAFCAGTFTFLHQSIDFHGSIDWAFSAYGALWTYNLNYFDFLQQPAMATDDGIALIRDFIDRAEPGSISFDPYPISLRTINWIKFLSLHQLSDPDIDAALYSQVLILKDNLEYHLLGNHLLENGFALLYAACYYADTNLLESARDILQAELDEQVLADGAHFELSPMYHQILLDRLLDCINLVRNNAVFDTGLEPLLSKKAGLMLGWLKEVTYCNGDIPLVNDAANGIAPSTDEILRYAQRLGVASDDVSLSASGYRKLRCGEAELFADVGQIGPDCLPAHAHADTLSFELHLSGRPLFVDSGTSCYGSDKERLRQRSTAAHNTLRIDGLNSSAVWGGFRVGRRAKVVECELHEGDAPSLSASHDGYRHLPGSPVHRRMWNLAAAELKLVDEITGAGEHLIEQFFHLHPHFTAQQSAPNAVDIYDGSGHLFSQLETDSRLSVTIEASTWHPEFGVSVPNQRICCRYRGLLGCTFVTRMSWC